MKFTLALTSSVFIWPFSPHIARVVARMHAFSQLHTASYTLSYSLLAEKNTSFVKPVIVEQFSISLSFHSLGSEYGFGRLLLFVLLLTVTEGPDYSSQYFRCIGAHITCTCSVGTHDVTCGTYLDVQPSSIRLTVLTCKRWM